MPFITPNSTPSIAHCWRIFIPNDEQLLGAILGQINELTKAHNWEQVSGITVGETIILCQTIFDDFSVGIGCMIGSLVHYVTVNPPSRVLECDGTQYLREDYPILYADLPASLIVDADNFIVPTIEDVFMLGSGVTYAPEDTGGSETHQLVENELPAHSHLYSLPTQGLAFHSAGPPDPQRIGLPFIPTSTSSVGSDTAHENMPPFVAYKVGIVAW